MLLSSIACGNVMCVCLCVCPVRPAGLRFFFFFYGSKILSFKVLTGDGDRDALRADDFTFSAASRTTYMASLLVFGAVISDAAMVERVIGMDVIDAAMAQAAGGRQRGAQGARRPTQLDIEGSGGRFWYEMGM